MELGLLSTTGMRSQEMLELIHPELVLEDLPYPIMFRLKKEVDQIFSDAVAAGAFPVKKSQPASWGGYSGYFRDLDGYMREVPFNPFTWIGPEDEKALITEPT